METLKFKTSIKCSACVAKVTPFLNEIAGIDNWEVDVINPDKLLSIESKDKIKAESIVSGLQNIGYRAQQVN